MRDYKNKEEKVQAFKEAVQMREKWMQAVNSGATRKQMEQMGLKAPCITE